MVMLSLLNKYCACWFPNNSYSQQQKQMRDPSWFPKILQLSCIRPTYTLRRQLVAGYGITAFVTVFIVVLISTIAANRAGKSVREESIELFRIQLDAIVQESGVMTGDILDKKMNSLRGSANLLVEIVRDRIVGYPNDGWENDTHVPFVDQETGRRVYPLKAELLPQDYSVKSNLDTNDIDNLAENLQERLGDDVLRPLFQGWNTERAMFSFQGNCDPNLTDPDTEGYYPFCSDKNNDASLGGKINPTTTLAPLEQKAADIGVFLKAIWEAQPLAVSIGVIFVNSGAGAMVTYPSFTADSANDYTSAGCDWMRETNSLTGRPYATENEINRCTPPGRISSIREYNGLERKWCSDQALHPGETRIFGPYGDVTKSSWRVTFGKAAFDRKTNELIACTYVELSLGQAQKLLAEIGEDMPSDMVVTKPDGTVMVGAKNETMLTPKLWETDFIDEETYHKLTDNLAFWEGVWDAESARSRYNFGEKSDGGKYFRVLPSPNPPDEYDPLYRPDFLIFGSIDTRVGNDKIDDIRDMIYADISSLIIIAVTFGAIGLCCMMTVVKIVAEVLTEPLKWMADKAWEIVNHTDRRVGNSLIIANENENDKQIQCFSFMPKTEVQELVSEFQSMITGFSGEGAATVAVPRHTETKNLVMWKEEFRKFYNLSPTIEDQFKEEMNMMTRSVSRRMSKTTATRRSSTSAIRRSSIRRTSIRRTSLRRYSTSIGMSTHDMEQILAAAEEVDDDDDTIEHEQQRPSFRSTQMPGESTTEKRSQSTRSSLSFSSSVTLSTAAITDPSKPMDSPKYFSEISPRPPTRINIGSNIQHVVGKRRLSSVEETSKDVPIIQIIRSPLYWNVLCWIVFPLLASIIAIMWMVGFQIFNTFPSWINEANNTSFDLEVKHLKSSTNLIVKHIEQIFVEPLHDLHTLHRMSGWLLFGAVGRSDGFTDIEMELVEECKTYKNPTECLFETNDSRSPCVCEWHDPWESTCKNQDTLTPPVDPRYLQKLWYINQKRKVNQTYPEVDFNPNSTSWYTDPDEMQGSDKASDAEGHSTAYDRVRVASALSTIIFPVYNHNSEARADGSVTSMSGYISFEADGAYGGFSGCNYDVAGYSHFESTDANNAYILNPDLCPLGKFGYDPRCRCWYANAKRQALENDGGLYISPPYRSATVDDIGSTAVSPLIDPKSGEFVGNTLIDFTTSEISKIFDKSKIQNYAVILPNATDGQNVVFSSFFIDESTPKSIYDLLAPHDPLNSTNSKRLAEIIQDMENKGTGTSCHLNITDSNGVQQQFCYVYKPIFHRELRPVQPDDFGRGAVQSTEFLYSIIMFQEYSSVSSEFRKRSDDIQRMLQRTFIVYTLTTFLTTLICIIVTATISFHVTRPMIQLLRTVKQVNAGGIEGDMPPLTGGSREVHQVYACFAKLHKTVHMTNLAFFVGDLSLAHRIAIDALNLFRKIGDKKAIAIACNNMGNTLLAWMIECREPGTSLELEGDDCTNCTEAAIKYYTEAVVSGTKEFERALGDAKKAQFAQQLADRHFNRAMCLLLTADDPCASSDAKETALDDLFLAKQYDQGVKEYMLQFKTLLKNSDVIFERSLRRLHGLAALIDIEPDVWDVWDIYELADQADLMLQAAWNQDKAPIFHNMTKVGRLQELESAVTGVELASGKGNDAVQLATRMLIEDEYLLDSAFIQAADCILQCSQDEDHDDVDEKKEAIDTTFCDCSIAELKKEFKTMRNPGMRNSLDIGRAFVFCIDLKGEWNGQPLLLKLRNSILAFYEENSQPNDTVGIVTFVPQDGTIKKDKPSSVQDLAASTKYPHRAGLVAATTGVNCSRFAPALQGGVEMALELESSSASDVCLFYISDGGAYDEAIFSRLRNKLEASSRSVNADLRASSRSISSASSIDLVVIGLGASQAEFANCSSMFMMQQVSQKSAVTTASLSAMSFEEHCQSLVLATRSRASIYLEADPNNLDEAFQRATASINEGTSFAGNRLQRALTMQKF